MSEKEEVTIEYVARLIASNFDYEDRIVFDSSFADGQYKKTADNSKLMEKLDNSFTFTTIEHGIKNSVAWFIDNYNQSRK